VLNIGAGTAVSGSATLLHALPPGPCTVLLSNAGTATPVYVGLGTALTTSNGFAVPSGVTPVVVPVYAGAGGSSLYAITAGGLATVGWVVSQPSGGTGF
jgi:hypothetical protein